MRRSWGRLAVGLVVVIAVSTAAPVSAFPGAAGARPDDIPHLDDVAPAAFRDQAAQLPEDLVDALDRDLGMSPARYLAAAERAAEAAELVTALRERGVAVNGGELAGDEVVIYLDTATHASLVEDAGARVVIGTQERADPAGVELEAADDLFGGEGWGYRNGGSYFTCSLGFSGYNASGDDVIVTAGHCFGVDGSPTATTSYDERTGDPQSLNRSQPSQLGGGFTAGDLIGTLVPGSKEFGNGRDAALLTTSYASAIARPQIAQYGSSGFAEHDQGTGAALDTTFPVTGSTAGFVGAPLCKSGARTGWTCGTIQEVDWNVSVSGKQVNSIKSDACAIPGDSGGVAVVGTLAVGIVSGTGFGTPPVGQWCSDSVLHPYAVFYHLVDPGLDGDAMSVSDMYGEEWTLCTQPVPFVTSLAPGGDPDGPVPLRGKLPCALAGEETTVSLTLDGSGTPYATVVPSGSAGSFEFSLAGVPPGEHSYELVATWAGETSVVTSGSFRIADRSGPPARLSGDDRYATAAAIAGEFAKNVDADLVFVATGENYPDALSAAAAAAHLGAPVLLTPKSSLPAVVKARLDAIAPERIIVLGSSASVSSSVVTALKSVTGGPVVQRIAGSDRYETARRVVEYAFDDGAGGLVDVPSVVIATGRNFPDALSAAPAVSRDGGAVILVDGSQASIPGATLRLIDELDPDSIVIAGATPSVSSEIEDVLTRRYGADLVTRVAGPDRYATSRLLTDRYWGQSSAVFFAVGSKYPDALAGAALAGALGAPLLVTERACMPGSMRSLVLSLATETRVLLGSSVSILDAVRNLSVC